MLVLTRRVGERVHVGDEIVVTLTRIAGDHVRLGIEAPTDVAVDREEIHERLGPADGAAGAGADASAADRIIVVVVRIKRHQARLGIAAPPRLPVDRAEVRDRAGNPAAPESGAARGRLVLSRRVGERIVIVPGGGAARPAAGRRREGRRSAATRPPAIEIEAVGS